MLPQEMQRRFETAQRLLADGRAFDAKREFAPVVAALPRDPGSRQFMGYILFCASDFAGATEQYRAALAGLPKTGIATAQVALQLADALDGGGRLAEAEATLRSAIVADSSLPEVTAALGRLLLRLDRAEEAHRLLEAWAGPEDSGVCEASAEAFAALGRPDEQILQLTRAVALQPNAAVAWHNLAAAEGNLHHFTKAEAAAARALGLGLNLPETWLVWARALSGLGRLDEAEAAFGKALALRPLFVEAHRDLAQLIWTRTGDYAQAARRFDEALAQAPNEQALIVERSTLAKTAGDSETARGILAEAAARPSAHPRLKGIAASMLMTTDLALAARYAEEAVRATPEDDDIQRTLAEIRLAEGDPGSAAEIVRRLLDRHPFNQGDLALAATARRLAGEPAGPLDDYAEVVRARFIDTPEGWSDLPSYLRSLTEALDRLHSDRAHPVGQSLRGGTQTRQNLRESEDPAIRAFPQAIDGAIRAYLSEMGQGDDVLRSRNTGGYRFAGLWSVRLRAQGYHVDHVHPEGWISSACHIALPSVVGAGGREGWLKFGEPGLITSPPLPPEHFVQPEAGKLVLFPSCMWHGTVPFSGDEPRLTVAFDLLPA